MWKTRVWSLVWEDSLEKEMAIPSSILVWGIPRMEEPGGPQSMGSQRVRHDWAANTTRNYRLLFRHCMQIIVKATVIPIMSYIFISIYLGKGYRIGIACRWFCCTKKYQVAKPSQLFGYHQKQADQVCLRGRKRKRRGEVREGRKEKKRRKEYWQNSKQIRQERDLWLLKGSSRKMSS